MNVQALKIIVGTTWLLILTVVSKELSVTGPLCVLIEGSGVYCKQWHMKECVECVDSRPMFAHALVRCMFKCWA